MTRLARHLLLLAQFAPAIAVAQAPASLRGTVLNETGRAIEHALVSLDPAGTNRQVRTDRDGTFSLIGVSSGTHVLRVTFVGYRPFEQSIEVTGRDTIAVTLERLAARLAEVEVTAKRSGLYGSVVSRDSLQPVPGARIEVIGARKMDTTEVDGVFNFPDLKPGPYMVRVTHRQFESRLESIVVPQDGGTSLDLVVRRGLLSRDAHMEMLYREMDSRVLWRGLSTAFVTREELRGLPTTGLDIAMIKVPSFMKASFYPQREGWESACLFVDGTPRPGAKLSDFSLEEIEAVEFYGGPIDRNEPTKSLTMRWPRGQPCGMAGGPQSAFSGGRSGMPTGLSARAVRVQFAVVWLRR